MKKIIARVSILALAALMLTGCTNDSSKKKNDEIATERAKRSISTRATTTETTPVETEPLETLSETTPAPTEAPTEAPVIQIDGPPRGTWDGDVYRSDYANITLTLPAGFIAASNEDLDMYMQMTREILENSEEEPGVLEMLSIYDLNATNEEGSSISITYQDLASNSALGVLADELDYLDLIRSEISNIEDTDGWEYIVGDMYDHQIGGINYIVMPTSIKITDPSFSMEMTQLMIVRKIEHYMLSVTLATVGDISAEDMLAAFQ